MRDSPSQGHPQPIADWGGGGGVQKSTTFHQDSTDSGVIHTAELSTELEWGQMEVPDTTTSLSSFLVCFI